MAFHPVQHVKRTCALCSLTTWQIGTLVAILAGTCALCGWTKARVDGMENKVEQHAVALAKIETVLQLLHRIDAKLTEKRDEK